jgi:hypothetical protein
MARPKFIPTLEQRKTVRSMSAFGLRQEDIANCIGIRSPKTLRRHFREELDRSGIEANARVAQTAFQMATSGKHPLMTMFWLRVRGGWREPAGATLLPANAPAFVVEQEKQAA